MDDRILNIIVTIFLIAIPLFYKNLSKVYILSFVVKRVQWIKANIKLDFIYSQGFKLVDEKYFLTKQDEEYAKQLLIQYINYMEQLSLRKDIPYKKEFQKLSMEEYAMCYLVSFLSNEQDKYRYNKEFMKYSAQDDKYEIYSLTDFGYAFYKIYNIAVTYCNKSEKIVKYIRTFYGVHEYLDSGTVKYFKK